VPARLAPRVPVPTILVGRTPQPPIRGRAVPATARSSSGQFAELVAGFQRGELPFEVHDPRFGFLDQGSLDAAPVVAAGVKPSRTSCVWRPTRQSSAKTFKVITQSVGVDRFDP